MINRRRRRLISSTVFCITILIFVPYGLWLHEKSQNGESEKSEGIKSLTVIQENASLNPDNEGKIIVAVDTLKSLGIIEDPIIGIKSNALQLKKVVEMFQWDRYISRRTKNDTSSNENKNYVYTKKWSSELISSKDFDTEHQNPDTFPSTGPYASYVKTNELVFGDFRAPQIPERSNPLERQKPAQVWLEDLQWQKLGGNLYKENEGNDRDDLNPERHYIFFGPKHLAKFPRIGNMRIYYEEISPAVLTVIAQQKGNNLVPYHGPDDLEVYSIKYGVHSADRLLESTISSTLGLLWPIRILGGITILICATAMVLNIGAFIAWYKEANSQHNA